MKQLTNDIYITKRKLELLGKYGIGQLIKDFCMLSKRNTYLPMFVRYGYSTRVAAFRYV